MSKWTIEKIKKQVKRGDTFSYENFDDRLIVEIREASFRFYNLNGQVWEYYGDEPWELFKFYRQGKEILPEPEYKYVNFDSFGELCEWIKSDGDIYCDGGCRSYNSSQLKEMLSLLALDYCNHTYFKRVEI